MSTFKHTCFISYRNGTRPDDLSVNNMLTTFAKQFKEALQGELDAYMKYTTEGVFLDVDNLAAGDFINAKISRALCESICMIVIYTRSYFSHDKLFCASELMGMLEREKLRCNRLGIENPQRGCIITIRLRGREEEIPDILSSRVYHDFDSFSLGQAEIRENPTFNRKVKEIAEYISDHCDILMEKSRELGLNLSDNCDTFGIIDITTDEGKQTVSEYVASITNRRPPSFPLTGSLE